MSVPSASEVLSEVERSLTGSPRVALCQIIGIRGSTSGKAGWKMLVRGDGSIYGNLGGGAFEAMVMADAQSMLVAAEESARAGASSRVERYYLTEEAKKGQPTGMACGGMVEVLLEVVSARPVLVVCGGGPVGQAVASQAVLSGFELVVADDREQFRQPDLFPQGTHLLEVDRDYSGSFLSAWQHRELQVTVVSRCWETDTAAVEAVLRQRLASLRYLGLMGSRRKVERVVQELVTRGADLEGVPWYAPIGLPIGGDSPAEIAVSIMAQIIQERHRSRAESGGTASAVRLA